MIIAYIQAGMNLYEMMGNHPGDMLEFLFQLIRAVSECNHENYDAFKKEMVSGNPLQRAMQELLKGIKNSKKREGGENH